MTADDSSRIDAARLELTHTVGGLIAAVHRLVDTRETNQGALDLIKRLVVAALILQGLALGALVVLIVMS